MSIVKEGTERLKSCKRKSEERKNTTEPVVALNSRAPKQGHKACKEMNNNNRMPNAAAFRLANKTKTKQREKRCQRTKERRRRNRKKY